MKKVSLLIFSIIMMAALVAGCSGQSSSNGNAASSQDDTITMAWYPNESVQELEAARNEFAKVIENATGKKVVHKTTTDYLIAIEAIVNGNADIALTGAEGYIQAHNKNDKVLPLFVPSGESGTLDDAIYYSWLCVKKGNEGQYKEGDKFKIDNIQGKKFSFVSNSSTSGFRVPTALIKGYFSKKQEWKDLTVEDLMEGGDFFLEVLYGGSHQGSAVNLLTGKADVAAFCDVNLFNYVDLVSGTANRPGAVYRIKEGAAEPFNTLAGKEFVVIAATPVLNAPFIYNSETLSAEDKDAILKAMTSDEVAGNEKIFVPKGSDFIGMYTKKANERFLEVHDEWFNPIRELAVQ
ncbi:MAG: Phosphonate ABC transporter substrate-binding protein PhnD [Firmicutes bacterium]|nr:Phosphonate ABC transporter substrate-binding protein PhnD [Bacillota bacterium]